MIIDLQQAPNNFKAKLYDVCVCGSGPAGVTLARIIASSGKSVAILEGGTLEYSEQSQQLYQGKSVGENDFNAAQTARLRFLGGTSNHWSGMCSYFDAYDFNNTVNNELPGWPIEHKEVLKYFNHAKTILDLPENAFTKTTTWPGKNFKPFNFVMSPPTRFNAKYKDELQKSKRIDLYLNANLTNVQFKDNLSTVDYFEVQNYHLKKTLIRAKQYVLAMGALENARTLLVNNKQLKTGIGNQSDLVGRCFMEHLNVKFGRFVATEAKFWMAGGVNIQPNEQLIIKNKIGNGVISFEPNAKPQSYGRTKAIKQALRNFTCKSESITNLSRKLIDFDCEGDGVIGSLLEQTPNLNSRVLLDTEKDMFGLPKLILNWQLNEFDRHTIKTIGLEASKELARLGVARVQLRDFVLDTSLPMKDFYPHAHHMGTTRMASSPKYGVVDTNSKVFGTDNLYVAGASVFPTGGGCNPTFTLTMLASRLGQHLTKL
jgi:choline dehydrogenase-like flavoprotein